MDYVLVATHTFDYEFSKETLFLFLILIGLLVIISILVVSITHIVCMYKKVSKWYTKRSLRKGEDHEKLP